MHVGKPSLALNLAPSGLTLRRSHWGGGLGQDIVSNGALAGRDRSMSQRLGRSMASWALVLGLRPPASVDITPSHRGSSIAGHQNTQSSSPDKPCSSSKTVTLSQLSPSLPTAAKRTYFKSLPPKQCLPHLQGWFSFVPLLASRTPGRRCSASRSCAKPELFWIIRLSNERSSSLVEVSDYTSSNKKSTKSPRRLLHDLV